MGDKLKVEVHAPVTSGDDLERIVDEDISDFDEYFQSLGNDPIVRSEKAIIKTWIWWHLNVRGEKPHLPETT